MRRSIGGQPRAAAPSLPAQLRPRPAMPFVGRAAELDRLAALPDRARTDGRQLALVGGEPGSGKTRLARELAEHVTAGGMHVLYGACDPAVRTALPAARRGARAGPRAMLQRRAERRRLPGVAASACCRACAPEPADPAEAIADAPPVTPMPSATRCTPR